VSIQIVASTEMVITNPTPKLLLFQMDRVDMAIQVLLALKYLSLPVFIRATFELTSKFAYLPAAYSSGLLSFGEYRAWDHCLWRSR